jgi:hypothetical protein
LTPDELCELARECKLAFSFAAHSRIGHFEWNTRLGLHAALDDEYLAICDSGADSHFFAKGWLVTGHTGRKVSVIGWDGAPARSRLLPLVTAETVVETAHGPIIIEGGEGVHNKNSNVTLLSEFCMRESGIVVDSVSRRHKGSNGQQGTQSIQLSATTSIELEVRDALMSFRIREPTDSERETLPRYRISPHGPWNPKNFYEDVLGIPPLIQQDQIAFEPSQEDCVQLGAECTVAGADL